MHNNYYQTLKTVNMMDCDLHVSVLVGSRGIVAKVKKFLEDGCRCFEEKKVATALSNFRSKLYCLI